MLRVQLARSGDQRQHCDQWYHLASAVHMRGEWRAAAAHLSLQTTRPNVDVRSRRRAHVKSTGAAEPRREKIFALEDVQAVSFLASVTTVRVCRERLPPLTRWS